MIWKLPAAIPCARVWPAMSVLILGVNIMYAEGDHLKKSQIKSLQLWSAS